MAVTESVAETIAEKAAETFTKEVAEEEAEIEDYKTFPLLTTSKSVTIKDPHGAKKTCISVIGDHPGFRPKN